MFVYADTGDRVHNGDVDSILKDVNSLHKRIVSLLPIPADAIYPETIDHEKFNKSGLNMVRPAVPNGTINYYFHLYYPLLINILH